MQPTNDLLQENLGRVYSAVSPGELERAYDVWAATYDHDMTEDLGWGGPEEAAKVLAERVSIAAPVLDFGAGTGLVGQSLHARGFTRVSAADLSREMLARAEARGVYASLHQVRADALLPFGDDQFEGLVSVGVLTQAHAAPDCMREWVRVVRPGGVVVFTLRPDLAEALGYAPMARALEQEGRWGKEHESADLEGFRRLQSKPYHVLTYRVR